MKVLTIICASIILTGCATTSQPKDPCADRPIYKPYSITLPTRPVLESTVSNQSDGQISRTAMEDMSKLTEYALELENLIKALPKDISVPSK